MLKKILIVFLFFILLIFLVKDYLLEKAILQYINREFNAEVSVEKANLSFREVTIEGLNIFNRDFTLRLEKGEVSFKLNRFLDIEILKLFVKDMFLEIKDLKNARDILKYKFTSVGDEGFIKMSKTEKAPLAVDLQGIEVVIRDPETLLAKIVFSFQADMEGSRVKLLRNLDIPDCNIKSKSLDVTLNFRRVAPGVYILKVPTAAIKGREIQDISIILTAEEDRFIFRDIETDLLGPYPFVSGVVSLEGYKSICLKLDVEDISFSKLVDLAGRGEDIFFEGLFEGDLEICLDGKGVSLIKGAFHNSGGGVVDIKKETSLNFLREHIDKASYSALINNLKNYRYNKAELEVLKKEGILTINARFTSEEMGDKNISVNTRKILGGKNVD